MAVCSPCLSFAMYHRGEWTRLKLLPGTEWRIPVPTTFDSKAALASIAANFLIVVVGLACIYSGFFVDDFVSLLLAILFKNAAMSTAFVYKCVRLTAPPCTEKAIVIIILFTGNRSEICPAMKDSSGRS